MFTHRTDSKREAEALISVVQPDTPAFFTAQHAKQHFWEYIVYAGVFVLMGCATGILLWIAITSGGGVAVPFHTVRVMVQNVSVTLYLPFPAHSSSRVPLPRLPVLLEFLPYRKDDSFYTYKYPQHSFLCARGNFVVAYADVPGTGSSRGSVVPKEYSDVELDFAVYLIDWLAKQKWSNGRVGMFGKSWSAFNSIMLAMRNPPALKAIYTYHGSEDLYYNDVHYTDGILRFDDYLMSVDHENGLPRSQNGYPIDDEYLADRFNYYPWHMVYLKQQLGNVSFYTNNSAMYAYDKLKIPMYLVGGLYDGYRDYIFNIYDGARAHSPKIKLLLGPFEHSEAYNSAFTPSYEDRFQMIDWFNVWLRPETHSNASLLAEPDVTLFLRDPHRSGDNETNIPGHFSYVTYPLQTKPQTYYFLANHTLSQNASDSANATKVIGSWDYRPSVGLEFDVWWGNLKGDQSPLNKECLSYDIPITDRSIILAGVVQVELLTRVNVTAANWYLRIDDVWPDGTATHVTGGAMNGAFRNGRDNISSIPPNETLTLRFPCHWTTYTFVKGHVLRVSLSTALFRAWWPSPLKHRMELLAGSTITLPAYDEAPNNVPPFTQVPVQESLVAPEGFDYDAGRVGQYWTTNGTGATALTWQTDLYYNVNSTFVASFEGNNFVAFDSTPEVSVYEAYGLHVVVREVPASNDTVANATLVPYLQNATQVFGFPSPANNSNFFDLAGTNIPSLDLFAHSWFELRTYIRIQSDLANFYFYMSREMRQNDTRFAFREWRSQVPRLFQ